MISTLCPLPRAANNDAFSQDLLFHVKWEGYPNKKDWTWEPEEHLK
jgi:hypothetical protein